MDKRSKALARIARDKNLATTTLIATHN